MYSSFQDNQKNNFVPEISLKASAQRDVESAIMDTL